MLFRNTDINTKRNAFFFLEKEEVAASGELCWGQGMAVFIKALGIT